MMFGMNYRRIFHSEDLIGDTKYHVKRIGRAGGGLCPSVMTLTYD